MQTQYRITVGESSHVSEAYPTNWAEIADQAEERGYMATIERRMVFNDASILDGLENRQGWLRLGAMVLTPWELLARAGGPVSLVCVVG